jgi:CheY-like chemotaxis protein
MAYKNVLLIDDDEEDQEIFLSVVTKLSPSVDCTCFNDATEALEQLSAESVTPDVIFLDLNMPMMDGQQFLSIIKQTRKLESIPVIIFTTSSDPNTIKNMKHLGAHDFITKPGSYQQLVALLEPLIG